MKIVCGLGNPGRKYEATRHNIGWMVIDCIASMSGARFSTKGSLYMWASVELGFSPVILLKPLTYMNDSGRAVSLILSKKQISASDLIVVHDDLDLATGRLRIKNGGGHGGHNGIRSIGSAIGTKDFVRVKIGIGRDEHISPVDYVLSQFKRSDAGIVDEAVEKAKEAIAAIVAGDDITAVIGRFN